MLRLGGGHLATPKRTGRFDPFRTFGPAYEIETLGAPGLSQNGAYAVCATALPAKALAQGLDCRLRQGIIGRVRGPAKCASRDRRLARGKMDCLDKETDAMSNPLIVVNSALYTAPGSAGVDVTANIQALFDLQYQNNPQLLAFTLPISPASFNINDPAPGYVKTLTIAYSIPEAGAGNAFARGGQDGQNLSLTVAPLNEGEVVWASMAQAA